MNPAGRQGRFLPWILLAGLALGLPGPLRGGGDAHAASETQVLPSAPARPGDMAAADIVSAAGFSSTDFEEFLRRHPVVAGFDPLQKRFRGTPSEFPDPQRLSRELAEVRQALADLESRRPAGIASQAAVADEEAFWNHLRAENGRRKRLQERERDLQERLAGPPTTPDESLLPIVRALVTEFRRGLPPGVVLNRFPRIPPASPGFEGGNPYAHFLETEATASLDLYLRSLPAAGGFFPSVRDPLLWPKPSSASGGPP